VGTKLPGEVGKGADGTLPFGGDHGKPTSATKEYRRSGHLQKDREKGTEWSWMENRQTLRAKGTAGEDDGREGTKRDVNPKDPTSP